MQITVGDLIAYLENYDDEAVVKFAVNEPSVETMNLTRCLDYGFISVSTEEVHGKEIIIHPYFGEPR